MAPGCCEEPTRRCFSCSASCSMLLALCLDSGCGASVLATFFSAQMRSAGGVLERRLVIDAPVSVESASKRLAALRACRSHSCQQGDAVVMAELAFGLQGGMLVTFIRCPDALHWQHAGAAPCDS